MYLYDGQNLDLTEQEDSKSKLGCVVVQQVKDIRLNE